MKKLLIIPLLVVLLAGCVGTNTGQQPIGGVNGLRIVDFSVSPEEAGPGEVVTVTYQLENSGDKPARNVEVKLIGPKGVVDGGVKTEVVGDLEPTDKRYGGSGEPYLGVFTITSPSNIPYNQKVEVPLFLRVYYDYSSSAVTDPVVVYSKEEWKRKIGKGESLTQESISITNNDGPIQFSVENSVNPVVDKTDSEPKIPIIVYVKNVGEGVPINNGEEGLLEGSISVISNSISDVQCKAGEDTFFSRDNAGSPTVDLNFKLTKRGEKKFVCYLFFNPQLVQDMNSFQLQFNFDYRYYISAQTSFTAWGNE